MDLSKLKRHRGAKDLHELESVLSGYKQQMNALQGEIDKITPNMRVSHQSYLLCKCFLRGVIDVL